jgi:hypothetical protein
MKTKINSDHPTTTASQKVTNGLYAIRIEMRDCKRGHPDTVLAIIVFDPVCA